MLAGRRPAAAGELYGRGWDAFAAGQYTDAATYLEAAATLRPDDAPTWAVLALAYRRRGAEGDAVAAADWAAAVRHLDPEQDVRTRAALVRVQGPERNWLDAARSSITARSAELALASPLPWDQPRLASR